MHQGIEDDISLRAARIYEGQTKTRMQSVIQFASYFFGGLILGAYLGIAPGREMTFLNNLLFIGAIAALFMTLRLHLTKKRYIKAIVFSFGVVPAFLFFILISLALRGDRYSHLYPSLTDDCKELRWQMTCGWANPLSRILGGLRCGDISFLWVQTQELKKGRTDLSLQCYGG